MHKKRLIPILFLKDGYFIRSQNFKIHRPIGDPILHVKRLVDWNIDELIILDIDTKKIPPLLIIDKIIKTNRSIILRNLSTLLL